MSKAHRRTSLALMAVAVLAVLGASIGGAYAALTGVTDNEGNVIQASSDFRAPAVTAVAVVKSDGGAGGYVRQGGGYHVYANVAEDTGNPPSGIASVTADPSALTAGSTTVSMTAGSYAADGTSYNYRSALLTVDDPLAEGPVDVSVTATDVASNSETVHGPATVDNTAPEAQDVQTANASGGVPGLAEAGDTLTLTTSEALDPVTVLAGWSGAPTAVVVRIYDGGPAADYVEIRDSDNEGVLPLGTVALGRTDYVTGGVGEYVEFGSSASLMELDEGDITITLGSYQTPTAATVGTAAGSGTAEWAPSTTPTDRAGNQMLSAVATESGAADVEF